MIKLLFIAAMLFATPCMAWDGYDYDKGNFVEIEKGRSVPMGSPIDHSIQYGCGMAKVSCMNDLYLNNK